MVRLVAEQSGVMRTTTLPSPKTIQSAEAREERFIFTHAPPVITVNTFNNA